MPHALFASAGRSHAPVPHQPSAASANVLQGRSGRNDGGRCTLQHGRRCERSERNTSRQRRAMSGLKCRYILHTRRISARMWPAFFHCCTAGAWFFRCQLRLQHGNSLLEMPLVSTPGRRRLQRVAQHAMRCSGRSFNFCFASLELNKIVRRPSHHGRTHRQVANDVSRLDILPGAGRVRPGGDPKTAHRWKRGLKTVNKCGGTVTAETLWYNRGCHEHLKFFFLCPGLAYTF